MFETMNLFIVFLILCGVGAAVSALTPGRRNPMVLSWIASASALAIILAAGDVLLYGQPFQLRLWDLFSFGPLVLRMDRLSALFVLVTGLVYLPVSIYSAVYMRPYMNRYSLRSFGIYYHLLFASIVLLLVAADIVTFLFSWEFMSILSYLLVNYKHEDEYNTRAGYLMLTMGEAGTVAVALALLLLAVTSGKLDFTSLKAASGGMSQTARWAVFLLSFFGFGVKVGLVPGNIWLPRAHPAATGNVSALLSGVILNLGLYGILRLNADMLPINQTGPGIIVLITGSISALVGILYATTENDLKRMLAHSSIENMGIMTAGLGAGFVFAASGYPLLTGIAFTAALYHMTNHALYKALLFLGVGAVDATVGHRDMDRLGGLIKFMPWTGLFVLAGALCIAALPPSNGFVSEWLTLQTMLRSAVLSSKAVKIVFALCGAALALTAALAVTCFVKAFAMSFLGISRSEAVKAAVEVKRSMLVPMAILALCCLLLGITPTCVVPVLDKAITPLTQASMSDALVPPFFTLKEGNAKFSDAFISEFHELGAQTGRGLLPVRGLVILHQGTQKNPVVFAMSTSYTIVVLTLLLCGAFLVIKGLTKARTVVRRPAWDGGLRRLMPQMTYTATGFSNPVRVIFEAVFRPTMFDDRRETIAEHFRVAIKNDRREVHIVDRYFFLPFARGVQRAASLLGRMHTGSVNVYAAYVLISLFIVLMIQGLMR
ncbi:MAG TPA: proton-conducting transporter membrane subunit [Syntrophobacteraceae bacterium]|nr:proton-conducting transporter membrane subunit [Syntrophobacteraceae bacterium]